MKLFDAKETRIQFGSVYQRGLRRAAPYWDFGYPILNQTLPELQSGLWYLIAPENVGKSMFMVNLGYNVLLHNPDAVWLDLSLDDSEEGRIAYLMARAGDMPISLVNRAEDAPPEEKARRKQAFEQFLESYGARYQLLGISDHRENVTIEFTAEGTIDAIRAARETIGPEAKLFVTVDGFHDLDLVVKSHDENDKQFKKSQALKVHATAQNALLVLSAHCRKDSRRRGLTADVMKGDDKPLYDAKVVTHLFSDLNLNREEAVVHWFSATQPEKKLPVHELDILKNKVGPEKKVIFYNFLPERCWEVEAPEQDQELYRSWLYSPEK